MDCGNKRSPKDRKAQPMEYTLCVHHCSPPQKSACKKNFALPKGNMDFRRAVLMSRYHGSGKKSTSIFFLCIFYSQLYNSFCQNAKLSIISMYLAQLVSIMITPAKLSSSIYYLDGEKKPTYQGINLVFSLLLLVYIV